MSEKKEGNSNFFLCKNYVEKVFIQISRDL